jgi:hypothetical protein
MHDVDREQLLALLKESPETFNTWRFAHPDAPIDLSDATLAGMVLDRAFFMGATLDRADLSRASLRGAIFSGGSLVAANLKESDLTGAVFGPPTLVDAQISLSALGKRIMYGADLTGANLSRAWLARASFLECALPETDLRGCDLSQADLRRADLSTAQRGDESDALSSIEVILQRLRQEPIEVRQSIMYTLFLVGVTNGWTGEINTLLGHAGTGLGFQPREIQALGPKGQINVRTISVVPPQGADAREGWLRLAFLFIIETPSHVMLDLALRLGELLGYSDPQTAAVLRRSTGLYIAPKLIAPPPDAAPTVLGPLAS